MAIYIQYHKIRWSNIKLWSHIRNFINPNLWPVVFWNNTNNPNLWPVVFWNNECEKYDSAYWNYCPLNMKGKYIEYLVNNKISSNNILLYEKCYTYVCIAFVIVYIVILYV